MSDLYRIKPLEWAEWSPRIWAADTILGTLFVREREGGGFRWYGWGVSDSCESSSVGKLAAEAYYRERLAPALETADLI